MLSLAVKFVVSGEDRAKCTFTRTREIKRPEYRDEWKVENGDEIGARSFIFSVASIFHPPPVNRCNYHWILDSRFWILDYSVVYYLMLLQCLFLF